jgi:twitching motility protein PilT
VPIDDLFDADRPPYHLDRARGPVGHIGRAAHRRQGEGAAASADTTIREPSWLIMTTTTTSPDLSTLLFGTPADVPVSMQTPAVIEAMLDSGAGISDLIFSPGRPPQVERHGELTPVDLPGFTALQPEDTARVARDLVGQNMQFLRTLREQGACDLSFALPGRPRFRVNVFRQRSGYAIVMRVIPSKIPSLAELKLPASLADIARLKNGIVLVTGPTGSGKSTTLAAIVDLINETRAEHILTIEDPIEFVHPHKKGTVHQRELHRDTPTFASALRSALRQAPKVILVGEMRDRETIEIAMTAAETGHLVFSTLHTIDASKTVERIVGAFDAGDQFAIRRRLAASFRYFISQRLIPKKDGGRVAILEMLKSTLRTRDYLEAGEGAGKTLLDAMRDGAMDGMQYFDGEIEKLVREGVITTETGLLYATNAGNLSLLLADVPEPEKKVEEDEDSLIIR